jgi:hypothetical protein
MRDRDAGTTPPIDAAANPKSGQPGIERAKGIVAELAEAARSVAEALADEQRAQASAQVTAVADAVRCAAQSLEQSRSPTMAHYAGEAAERVEHIADAIRHRRWRDILADTEDFARRQPMLFVLATIAAGYAAGRVLSISTDQHRHEGQADGSADRAPDRGEPDIATAMSNPVSGVREVN